MKKIFSVDLLHLFFLFLITVSAAAESHVVLLHTNDTHARIVPFDHKTAGPDSGGMVRRAGLVKQIRNKHPYALLLDAGDMFQGTPIYSVFKGEACFRAAVACGYDATTMGNHELDNNLANLKKQIELSGMRFLCCNIFIAGTEKTAFAPYHIFNRNGVRIGVIGSIGNDAYNSIDRKIRAGLEGRDQTTCVRDTARRIRPYVDLVVVLSHAGIIEDKQMAAEIAEIDVIIGGHSHEELQTPLFIENLPQTGPGHNGLNGTIVAQAFEHGVFLGRIDLKIDAEGKIATWSGRLERVMPEHEKYASDSVKELVDSYVKDLNRVMNEVIGFTGSELSLPKELKKTHMLPMGTFTALTMLEAGKADFCAVNSGAIRRSIDSGEITRGDIFEALPYDNTVITFTMQGKEVQQMMDFIAASHADLDGFQFAGIEAELNLASGKAHIKSIAGQPFDLGKSYRAATTSFVANGNLAGDKLFARVERIEDSGIFMRDAAIDYLTRVKTLPDLEKPSVEIIRSSN